LCLTPSADGVLVLAVAIRELLEVQSAPDRREQESILVFWQTFLDLPVINP
jgi:hypothetical protein